MLRNRSFGGRSLVYLDSAATSQTPQPVIDAMTTYYTHTRASIHRGVYPLAAEATDPVRGRPRPDRRLARLDARGDDLHGQRHRRDQHGRLHVGPENVQRGDLVVLTEMEHHSNIVPWQLLCQDREAELAYVPVSG